MKEVRVVYADSRKKNQEYVFSVTPGDFEEFVYLLEKCDHVWTWEEVE